MENTSIAKYPEWLAQLQNDPEFIANLNHEMESAEVRASSHGAVYNPNQIWMEMIRELWDFELECRQDLARRGSIPTPHPETESPR